MTAPQRGEAAARRRVPNAAGGVHGRAGRQGAVKRQRRRADFAAVPDKRVQPLAGAGVPCHQRVVERARQQQIAARRKRQAHNLCPVALGRGAKGQCRFVNRDWGRGNGMQESRHPP